MKFQIQALFLMLGKMLVFVSVRGKIKRLKPPAFIVQPELMKHSILVSNFKSTWINWGIFLFEAAYWFQKEPKCGHLRKCNLLSTQRTLPRWQKPSLELPKETTNWLQYTHNSLWMMYRSWWKYMKGLQVSCNIKYLTMAQVLTESESEGKGGQQR